jgi:hypothetical protein
MPLVCLTGTQRPNIRLNLYVTCRCTVDCTSVSLDNICLNETQGTDPLPPIETQSLYFSTDTTSNKLLIYKTILKRSTALEYAFRFQQRNPRTITTECFAIVDAPWNVQNPFIRRDFQTPTVKEEIRSQYSAHFSGHPNNLSVILMELPDNMRLQRHLPTRFLV